MHQQFNIQQLYVMPTHCIYVFCIYLRTNSDLCRLHHKLIGFYNQDEKRLLRGTTWVFNPYPANVDKMVVSYQC
jgi:hypothetical protein